MEGFFNFVSLEQKIRYTLGKKDRLKSRKTIDRVFKQGLPVTVFPIRVIYLANKYHAAEKGNELQAGFTVSTRHFKKAVDRNRIRRLMKESYRVQKNELKLLLINNMQSMSIFFIYVGKELPQIDLVNEKMRLILQRLILLTGEGK